MWNDISRHRSRGNCRSGAAVGFEAEWKRNAKFSDLISAIKRSTPVIAIVDARLLHSLELPVAAGHMIVIVAVTTGTVFYHDPEVGRERTVSRQIFMQAWENFRKGMVTIWR